jgi:hypothetical protein
MAFAQVFQRNEHRLLQPVDPIDWRDVSTFLSIRVGEVFENFGIRGGPLPEFVDSS